uniref:Uncharacterized protein n=1 Tax=Rhizophora mucronata TaxID=61149 RepID=A0A2P2KS29_RHIMU
MIELRRDKNIPQLFSNFQNPPPILSFFFLTPRCDRAQWHQNCLERPYSISLKVRSATFGSNGTCRRYKRPLEARLCRVFEFGCWQQRDRDRRHVRWSCVRIQRCPRVNNGFSVFFGFLGLPLRLTIQ